MSRWTGIAKAVEDALYTAMGLGVLGVQHLQVQRRQLERTLSTLTDRSGPRRRSDDEPS